MKMRGWLLVLGGLPLMAQAPEGWDRRERLGEAVPIGDRFFGAGVWAANKSGPALTLVDSLGLGNALVGGGALVELGQRGTRWRWGAQLRAIREPGGVARLSLERGHLLYSSLGGWELGVEKEPLVWGYGLQGGYLLGEAARPFPKAQVSTPWKHLSAWKVPLGTWKAQAFLGQLEADRKIGESSQDPLSRAAILAAQGGGGIRSPLITGFRVEAKFAELTEFYANYINLWGGTLNGRSMLEGYNAKEYLTAAFGLKDALVEGGMDYKKTYVPVPYINKARSGSNSDVGARVRFPIFERWTGAEDVRIHISRGSKGVNMYYQRFFTRPLHYFWEDIRADLLSLKDDPTYPWEQETRYALPSPAVPNDTVGLVMAWPHFRLGLEYQDLANRLNGPSGNGNHRSFEHGIYAVGFYTHGDPLGTAMGGEARTMTLHVQYDLGPRVKGRTWLLQGQRPFRDDITLWREAHPGLEPRKNRYVGAQQDLELNLGQGLSLSLGAAWQHQGAVEHVPGNSHNGFRWFSELAWRGSRK